MLNVIGVGFARTGTTSQHAALEALGFHCYRRPERAHLWEAAAAGQPVDWEEIFGGYQATVGFPGAVFWKELVDAYPDAKVLLSVRDPDRWYDSVKRTILQAAQSGTFSKVFPPEFQRVAVKMSERFGDLWGSREQAIEVLERHNQEVRRYVPAERLLVYEVTEGWEPLCAFLGLPVPAGVPFPYFNDTEAFQAALLENLALRTEGAAHDRQAAVAAE